MPISDGVVTPSRSVQSSNRTEREDGQTRLALACANLTNLLNHPSPFKTTLTTLPASCGSQAVISLRLLSQSGFGFQKWQKMTEEEIFSFLESRKIYLTAWFPAAMHDFSVNSAD
jgi:hypothetical protein